jgi:hypothetical protein
MCPYDPSALPEPNARKWDSYGCLVEELDGYADCAGHFGVSKSYESTLSTGDRLCAPINARGEGSGKVRFESDASAVVVCTRVEGCE